MDAVSEAGVTASRLPGGGVEPARAPLLSVRGLTVAYGGERHSTMAVRGVDFDVFPGEIVAVVGESGSGKSTTAHAIIGLLHGARIEAGCIQFDGRDITRPSEATLRRLRGASIGLIPQDPTVSLNPVLRVGEQIAEVLQIHGMATRRDASLRALEILQQVGISRPEMRARQYPHELSGGMRQRVLIGIALACKPKFVIADELTSALDVTVQRRVLDYLIGMTRQLGTAVLLITHDLAMASDRADRILVMRGGLVVEAGGAQEILQSPKHEYTKSLIAAAPGLAWPEKSRVASPQTMTKAEPRLELVKIGKDFRAPDGTLVTAVHEVSLRVQKGQTFSLVGESGSGKTTTARIAVQFETASRGAVLLDGMEVRLGSRRERKAFCRRVQYVHQNPYASLDPRFTLSQILSEPLVAFDIGSRREREMRARELLEQVALPPDFAHRRPAQLSGGQRQRVAIARALALQPELIILDEPVSALDVIVQEQILRLLDDLQKALALTYLFISHDLAVVRRISDYVGVMRAGELVESGRTDDLFAKPQHPYTQELMDSIPGRLAKLHPIQ